MSVRVLGTAALLAVVFSTVAFAESSRDRFGAASNQVEQQVSTKAKGRYSSNGGSGVVYISARDRGSAPIVSESSFFSMLAPRNGKAGSKQGENGSSGSYSSLISRYASSHGIPVSLANAVVRIESNYRANARGRAGEIGLMQLKLSTARMMGYSGSAKGLYHPETNIKYGMKYLALAHKLGGGSTCGTILKYNAGHGAKRMNPVSSRYCSKVKRHMKGA